MDLHGVFPNTNRLTAIIAQLGFACHLPPRAPRRARVSNSIMPCYVDVTANMAERFCAWPDPLLVETQSIL